MIKFQQSQALTSHIESFWSIVSWEHWINQSHNHLQATWQPQGIEKY